MTIKTWQAVSTLVAPAMVLTLWELPAGTRFGTGGLSLAAGVAALTMMAAAALLASRWRWVEHAFGGLDRVYATHKWLGIWALAFATLHFLFKAGAESWSVAPILALPGPWTRFVRQLSYVALGLIVLLALNRNIPYSTWRWWHRLSGPLFLVVVLHWLSFRSPIRLAGATGIWLAAWSALGAAGALYKLLLYHLFARQAEYEVVEIHPGKAAAHIQLSPVAHPVRFVPGQFGFLRMNEQGLREPHPFTIASGSGGDGRVDFVIRALGDFTTKLVAQVRPGMRADVFAPYGRFARRPDAPCEVWIGGGVGISPFIAWLQDQAAGGFDKVTLFYFHTPGRAFPEMPVLEAMAAARGVELVGVAAGPDDPAFAERFAALCREYGPASVDVAVCGPQGLLASVRARLAANGVPAGNLRYELFEFR
jgi:predicted ferric reductase